MLQWLRYVRSGRALYVASNKHSLRLGIDYFNAFVKPTAPYILSCYKTIPPHVEITPLSLIKAWRYPPAEAYGFWTPDENVKMYEALTALSRAEQSTPEYEEAAKTYREICARHRWYRITDRDISDAVYFFKKAVAVDMTPAMFQARGEKASH